jgi:hypothetical protein
MGSGPGRQEIVQKLFGSRSRQLRLGWLDFQQMRQGVGGQLNASENPSVSKTFFMPHPLLEKV